MAGQGLTRKRHFPSRQKPVSLFRMIATIPFSVRNSKYSRRSPARNTLPRTGAHQAIGLQEGHPRRSNATFRTGFETDLSRRRAMSALPDSLHTSRLHRRSSPFQTRDNRPRALTPQWRREWQSTRFHPIEATLSSWRYRDQWPQLGLDSERDCEANSRRIRGRCVRSVAPHFARRQLTCRIDHPCDMGSASGGHLSGVVCALDAGEPHRRSVMRATVISAAWTGPTSP